MYQLIQLGIFEQFTKLIQTNDHARTILAHIQESKTIEVSSKFTAIKIVLIYADEQLLVNFSFQYFKAVH